MFTPILGFLHNFVLKLEDHKDQTDRQGQERTKLIMWPCCHPGEQHVKVILQHKFIDKLDSQFFNKAKAICDSHHCMLHYYSNDVSILPRNGKVSKKPVLRPRSLTLKFNRILAVAKKYTFMQHYIKQSAAIYGSSCSLKKREEKTNKLSNNAENNTAIATVNSNQDMQCKSCSPTTSACSWTNTLRSLNI